MIHVDHVTIAVAAALTLTVLAVFISANWRAIKRNWARVTWTPRLTPGVRAEWIITMGWDGRVGVQMEKLAPEENGSEIFAQMIGQILAVGEEAGYSIDWQSDIGAVIQGPDGRPLYTTALTRPRKKLNAVRAMTDDDERAVHEGGGVSGGTA